MSLEFSTEVRAGDINLTVTSIWVNLNHRTGRDLQGSVEHKGEVHRLDPAAPQHLEVRGREEAVKETKAVGCKVKQNQESMESQSTCVGRTQEGTYYQPCKMVESYED